ncbi:Coatomer subunit epsilon-1 [Hibiscus syriacus]|uniref:Coatomer subunit epsilon-1 n=1 Tax=Hibiscus syriacus TaxID=106335 RepID=A0A6A2XN45_HIBSY|nr:Coatomer subunit epsilon-1 [Hibiscus syriacus]
MAGNPDHLFNLRNNFYLGSYQVAIYNSDIPHLSTDDAVERDCILYRSYIALGSYQLVISEIDSSAATPLQAVKLLALYLSNPRDKESAISSLKEWLADPAIGNNAILRLIAGIVLFHEEDYNEALKHTNAGGTIELSGHLIFRLFSLSILAASEGSSAAAANNRMVETPFMNKYVNVRLDDNNFLLWKQQVLFMIQGHELEHLLDESLPIPPQTIVDESGELIVNPAYRHHKKQDSLLASGLLSTISPSILPQLHVLEALHYKDYEPPWKTHVSLKKGDLYMRKFSTQIKEICDLLATSGSPVSEIDKIVTLLNGLLGDFEPFVVAIIVSREPYTFDTVTSVLIDAESRIGDLMKTSVSINLTRHNNYSGGNANGNRDKYYTNNRLNDTREKTQNMNKYKGRPRHQCQLCGKIGHLVDRCWHRFDENFKGVASRQSIDTNEMQANVCKYDANDSSYNPFVHTAIGGEVVTEDATTDTVQINSLIVKGVLSATDKWYPDSGATHHVSNDKAATSLGRPYSGKGKVYLGNGSTLPISHISNVPLTANTCDLLKNVLCIPKITRNLLSVSKLTQDNNVYLEFHSDKCFVKDERTGRILLEGKLENGLYCFNKIARMDGMLHQVTAPAEEKDVKSNKSFWLWHRRLGHPVSKILSSLFHVKNVVNDNSEICVACQLGKSHRLPFMQSDTVYSRLFELVETDVWGPTPIKSGGWQYYVSFIDMYSRNVWVYLMCNKLDITQAFNLFHALIKNQFKTNIVALQTDGGGKYRGLERYLAAAGIKHMITCPHTSQHNGVVERKHRHIIDTTLTLLAQSAVPFKYWSYAVLTAVYLINRLPANLLGGISSFEKLYDSSHTPGVSVSHHDRAYTMEVEPDVVSRAAAQPEATHSESMHSGAASNDDQNGSASVQESGASCRTVSDEYNNVDAQHTTNRHHMVTRSKAGIFKPKVYNALFNETPLNVQDALQHKHWRAAGEMEFKALTDNNTWKLVPLPADRKVIGCKWLFRIKHNSDGFVNRFKARLVAKGYSQVPGCDFVDTFSHVVRFFTINVLLSVAASRGWQVYQVDVNNAFLKGDLQGGISSEKRVNEVKKQLHDRFSLKDLGLIHYFFGIEAVHTTTGMFLNQKKYVEELLTKFSVYGKPVDTPLPITPKLSSENTGAPVAQFMQSPCEAHWTGVKRILRYLKGTMDYGLWLNKGQGQLQIKACTDADWGSDPDDRRSIFGYCVYLGSHLLSWSSRKQRSVSRSTVEAEYRSLADTTAEVLWVKAVLDDMNVELSQTPVIWCDNTNTVAMAANPVLHAKVKHVDLDVHFVREKVMDKQLIVNYVPANCQFADVLTKPLVITRFQELRQKLNVFFAAKASAAQRTKKHPELVARIIIENDQRYLALYQAVLLGLGGALRIGSKMHRSDYAERQLRVMQQIDEDHTLTQLANAWLNLAVGGSKIQEAYLIFQDFSEKYLMTGLILNGKADAKDPEALANLVVCSLHLGNHLHVKVNGYAWAQLLGGVWLDGIP